VLDVTLTGITHIAVRTAEVTEVVQSNPGASAINVLTYATAERASIVLCVAAGAEQELGSSKQEKTCLQQSKHQQQWL
jgi:hypothetical protein